jgi:hypothetical protein
MVFQKILELRLPDILFEATPFLVKHRSNELPFSTRLLAPRPNLTKATGGIFRDCIPMLLLFCKRRSLRFGLASSTYPLFANRRQESDDFPPDAENNGNAYADQLYKQIGKRTNYGHASSAKRDNLGNAKE